METRWCNDCLTQQKKNFRRTSLSGHFRHVTTVAEEVVPSIKTTIMRYNIYVDHKLYRIQIKNHRTTSFVVSPPILLHLVGNFLTKKLVLLYFRVRIVPAYEVRIQYLRTHLKTLQFNKSCLMYHTACKVEFPPFKRPYSQLTFFNFL